MLISVDVFGAQAIPQLTLPIFGAEDEPIQIKGVEGLEPVRANISTALLGAISGEAITGTSIGKRNVVLTLGLNPDWETQTHEELRMLLYRYFMPESPLTLRFTSTHLPTCQIDGVVESIAPNMFSKDPECQVSIICGRPDLVAVTKTTVSGAVGDSDDIEYVGSAKTGVELVVMPSAIRGAYTGTLSITLGAQTFALNDVTIDDNRRVVMSSVPGDKYVRNGLEGSTNLLGKVQSGYTWPQLKPGLNSLTINAELPGQNWELSYFARFGGL